MDATSPRQWSPWLLVGCVTVATGCAGADGVEWEEEFEFDEVSEALTPTQPHQVRPNINSFTAAQRTTLANAILAFITQSVLDEHASGHDWHHPAVGELFFSRHHDYLNQLENYLLTNGHSAFVPVPEWDPGTAIPSQFLVTDPLVSQTPLNANPNRPIPAEFANHRLCEFSSASDLAVDVESWHDGVHGAVGGAMASIAQAPGAPIFWLWHGLLDDMYHERTWRCETLPAIVSAVL